MNRVRLVLIVVLSFLSTGCSKESSNNPPAEYRLEIVESLSHGPNLSAVEYDQETNSYAIAYWDDASKSGTYELRDVDFNITSTGIYGNRFSGASTITVINDSVFPGTQNSWDFYRTAEGQLIRMRISQNTGASMSIYGSGNDFRDRLFYYDFAQKVNRVLDTKDYIAIASQESTCFLVRKPDFEVISFEDFFGPIETFGGGGGVGLGVDAEGRILLSTRSHGVKVYDNNEWISFLDGELEKYGQTYGQLFVDSKNWLYAVGGKGMDIIDLNSGEEIITLRGVVPDGMVAISGGRVLGEHPDGTLIVMAKGAETDFRLFKVSIVKN